MSKQFNYAAGKEGERIAQDYLKKQGFKILETNVRSPFGEIDLIAKDHDTIVFIEVKWRKNSNYGHPEEALSPHKRDQLIRLASWYLSRFRGREPAVRFDVLAIEEEGPFSGIRLIKNALEV